MDIFGKELVGIIDGSNFAFRAGAVLDLNYEGCSVSVIYGFCRMLISLQKKFNFSKIYVCWDRGLSERRLKILKTYKKKILTPEEKEKRNEIIRQIAGCEEICQALGIPSLAFEKTEADDIIYAICKIVTGNKIIVSTDTDFFQLISDSVSVYNPVKQKMYDKHLVKEELGVDVENYVFFKAIVGDTSDGIIGVKGIGEKTASKLLQKYDIQDILDRKVEKEDLKKVDRILSEKEKVADNCELISFSRVEDALLEKVKEEIEKPRSVDFSLLNSIIEKYGFNFSITDFEIFL